MGISTSKKEQRVKMGPAYVRQNSKPDAIGTPGSAIGHQETEHVPQGGSTQRPTMNAYQHTTAVQIERAADSGSVKGHGSKLTHCKTCLKMFFFAVIIFGLSTGSCIAYMKYIAPNENKAELVDLTQSEPDLPIASRLRQPDLATRSTKKVIGRFTVEQEILHKSHQLRWQRSVDAPITDIEPSNIDSCVIVPSPGTYMVVSQVTFKFTAQQHYLAAGHSVVVKDAEGREDLIQRKDVPVTILDGQKGTIKEPSNLIVFPYVNAQDKICVNASPIDAIYISPVSNMLTLFKL